MTQYLAPLLPVLAAALSLIGSNLNADGGASVLSRFTAWRLSVAWLAALIVVDAGASAAADALVNGQDGPHAVAIGLMAIVTGLLGGTMGHLAHHAVGRLGFVTTPLSEIKVAPGRDTRPDAKEASS